MTHATLPRKWTAKGYSALTLQVPRHPESLSIPWHLACLESDAGRTPNCHPSDCPGWLAARAKDRQARFRRLRPASSSPASERARPPPGSASPLRRRKQGVRADRGRARANASRRRAQTREGRAQPASARLADQPCPMRRRVFSAVRFWTWHASPPEGGGGKWTETRIIGPIAFTITSIPFTDLSLTGLARDV